MKIFEPGKVGERWAIQRHCTERGNGGNGCEALLEIEYNDLRYYEGQEFPWKVSEPVVCFKCPCCGKITDLDTNEWPTRYGSLPRWTSEWRDAKPSSEPALN